MPRPVALHYALDLTAMPSLAGLMQREPLPQGVLDVIRIAARCPETWERTVTMTGQEPETLRDAAVLYLQTALFFPSADNYRVLGVAVDAPRDEIRQHLRWLMLWLHPDRQLNSWESTFAERVLSAWEEVKSPERRAQYDRTRPPAPAETASRSRQQWRRPWLPWVVQKPEPTIRKAAIVSRRVVTGLVIGLAALTILFGVEWPFNTPFQTGSDSAYKAQKNIDTDSTTKSADANGSAPAIVEK